MGGRWAGSVRVLRTLFERLRVGSRKADGCEERDVREPLARDFQFTVGGCGTPMPGGRWWCPVDTDRRGADDVGGVGRTRTGETGESGFEVGPSLDTVCGGGGL